MDEPLRTPLAVVITAVWAVSFIADLMLVDYTPSQYIHMIMLAVSGAIFGKSFIGRNGRDDEPTVEPQDTGA